MEMTKKRLCDHCKAYPTMTPSDVFKYIYQSAFGCEHMVSDPERVTRMIEEEYANMSLDLCRSVEELDGDFCRVPLSVLDTGLSAKTLGMLFFLSAKDKGEGGASLLEKIDAARKLAFENKFPFDGECFEKALSDWEMDGYPAIRHSEAFREKYCPAYRVISKKHVPFLGLFAEIDKRLGKGDVTVALEGGSASGKTTLAKTLSEIYDCNVFHRDDFFLQMHQRTPRRFKEAGGNMDRERFEKEVLEPLKRGETVRYRKFDCSKMAIGDYVEVEKKRLTIIEGAYSMHPKMDFSYDISAFLSIPKEAQKRRIENRNTPELARRFFNEWIPMEEKYFSEFGIRKKCSMVIETE